MINSIRRNKEVEKKIRPKITWYRKEWDLRIYKCSKRLLSAVSYKINSNEVYNQNNSVILPIIGLYYSLFHLSTALLNLDYTTDLSKLEQVRHSTLIKLIKSKLISRKLISFDLYNTLIALKEIREHTNYKFEPIFFEFQNKNIGLEEYYTELVEEVDLTFSECISFIHALSSKIGLLPDETSISFKISTFIGDSFGDDTYETYLSSNDEIKVIDYLIVKGLTT